MIRTNENTEHIYIKSLINLKVCYAVDKDASPQDRLDLTDT